MAIHKTSFVKRPLQLIATVFKITDTLRSNAWKMTPSSNEAIGLQQSLGCGRSSTHFFFFFTRNDPILCQGISNTTAFFMGRNVFYKSVCNRYNKETKAQLRRKSNLVHLHVKATPWPLHYCATPVSVWWSDFVFLKPFFSAIDAVWKN